MLDVLTYLILLVCADSLGLFSWQVRWPVRTRCTIILVLMYAWSAIWWLSQIGIHRRTSILGRRICRHRPCLMCLSPPVNAVMSARMLLDLGYQNESISRQNMILTDHLQMCKVSQVRLALLRHISCNLLAARRLGNCEGGALRICCCVALLFCFRLYCWGNGYQCKTWLLWFSVVVGVPSH